MDRVKFGRALGYGARHAAKTLTQAVDAASAPNPATQAEPKRQALQPRQVEVRPRAEPRQMPDTETMKAAGRQAKSSLVTPVVRFSSVVWLQVSGVFFALIAFIMGNAAWRARSGFHAAAHSHAAIKLYTCVAVCAVFIYFTVSSFVRAARR